jgi:hypothetical protein
MIIVQFRITLCVHPVAEITCQSWGTKNRDMERGKYMYYVYAYIVVEKL